MRQNLHIHNIYQLFLQVEKADCLNGGDHDFRPTKTFPKEYTEMECAVCEARRDLTKVERTILNIQTPATG